MIARVAFRYIATLALCLLPLVPGSAYCSNRDIPGAITVASRARTYLLHVPPSIPADKPVPLVLVFHGGAGTGKKTAGFTGFDAPADREGFIVAYPDGIGRSWNDGRGTTKAAKSGADDVRFARELIQRLSAEHKVDPRRIYATGPSNGGFMSHRLACELSDVLAAVGPVIAGFPSKLVGSCRPAAPVSIVMIQGEADRLVPIAGGEVGGKRHWGAGGRTESAESTRAFWAERSGCPGEPQVSDLPDRAKDGTSVREYSWRGCRAGVDVVQYVVAGMGHRWPTSLASPKGTRLAGWVLGPGSGNIDATETVWEFFKAHRKP